MRGIGDQRAGDGDALALAARQAAAALADDGVVAFRQLEDEVVRAGQLAAAITRSIGIAGSAKRDVLAHRAVEQDVLLQHDADLAAQPGRIDQGEIDAVDQHAAALRHVEPLHQLGEVLLPEPEAPTMPIDLAGLDLEASRAAPPARRAGSGR